VGDITTRFLATSLTAVLRNLPGVLYLVSLPLGGVGVAFAPGLKVGLAEPDVPADLHRAWGGAVGTPLVERRQRHAEVVGDLLGAE